jgi:hypothetical protein
VLPHGVQDLLNVLQMLCPSSIEGEDVIQIYHHKIFCELLQEIILINVFGALVKTKGMTNHSKIPYLDLKEIFHTKFCSNQDFMVN